MGFNLGIVGLPNVGKSTLFNALTETQAAESANYPFCTIEPNVGKVSVPDTRLDKLAAIAGSAKIIPNQLEFVDIAGLVKGASKGEGLGNQFLANIREVDAVCHVLRCFDDGNITHVEDSIDPVRDAETVETELMLADMESLERRIHATGKKSRGGDKNALLELDIMERALAVLQEGKPARMIELEKEEEPIFKMMQLLTSKPILYVCNVDEDSAADGNQYTAEVAKMADATGAGMVIVSAAIEAEVALLETQEEKDEFLESLGLEETGLARVIQAGFALLKQLTFFTIGPKEARAWTVRDGLKAPQAAGVIHTDFERGYICGETISYDDYIACEGEQGAKEAGKLRLEGRDYFTKDGDVFHFRFNV